MEITGAFVLKGEIEDINKIEDYIRELTDATIVYQCSSGGKLFITKDEPAIEL